MKLWGQISIELDVADYVAAADHQRRLQDIFEQVRVNYPQAQLTVRERRQRRATPAVRPMPPELRASLAARS